MIHKILEINLKMQLEHLKTLKKSNKNNAEITRIEKILEDLNANRTIQKTN